MSRVIQRELLEGEVATAASLNATLASWNAAASAVAGDNVREEGLHIRNFAAGSIKRPEALSDIYRFGNPDPAITAGAIISSAVFVTVTFGGNPAVIGPFDISDTYARLVVHASFLVRISHPGQIVTVGLAQSTDGVTFSDITNTQRTFRGRSVMTPYTVAAFEQSCVIATRIYGASPTTYVALRARGSGGDPFSVNCSSIFGEVFNK